MTELFHQEAFQLYALSSAIVIVTLYGLAAFTGNTRMRMRAVLNAEDTVFYRGAALVDVEHAAVQRVKRAHLNLIENAIPFLVIGGLYALTNPNPLLARGLFGAFVVARLSHVYFYLNARQPWRAYSWLLGVAVTLVMLVQVVRAAL